MYHGENEHLNKQIQAKQTTIQTTSKALQELKVEKLDTETKLQETLNTTGQLQAENAQLKSDLQAKHEREAEEKRIASLNVTTYGGRGGADYVGTMTRGSSEGNTYDFGYCTWYVKNRRPDLPNQLGNANQWYGTAQAMGLSTGATPRVGAVGANGVGHYGHVVYVEAVNGDGTITISEMNYDAWGAVDTRVTSPSEFIYIY